VPQLLFSTALPSVPGALGTDAAGDLASVAGAVPRIRLVVRGVDVGGAPAGFKEGWVGASVA